MAVFCAGSIIKEYRVNRGLKVERLCEGICNASTLRYIEKGQRVPSVFVFKALMERLGLEARKFYISVSNLSEIEFFNKYYEATALIMEKNFEVAYEVVNILKNVERGLNKDEGAKIREQMILALKCGISQGKNEDLLKQYEMIRSALMLTLPEFDEAKISEYLLSYDEISLLNMLASTYKNTIDSEKKISILYQVKSSMDKYYCDMYEKSRGYLQTLYNLSNALGFAKRHEEVLEICEIAIQCSVKNKRLFLLPHINFNKACALFYTGDIEASRNLVIKAIYALENNGAYQDAEIRKRFAEKEMHICFPF